MPLFEETNQTKTNQSNQTDKNDNQTQQKPSGVLNIVGQLLPLAPFVFEQFTGQKVPQMTGTIAEMQLVLVQIQTNLQNMVNVQQNLSQRLINLETKLDQIQTSANQHLINLTNQFNSLRLTHTREKKQIEYGTDKSRYNQSQLNNSEEEEY
jgi:hypothetical protein